MKNCDIAICCFARHRDTGTEYFRPCKEEYLEAEQIGSIFWEYQRRELWGTPWNKMYRKELILHEFDSHMNCGEDMVFNMRYMTGKQCFGFTEKILYNVYSPVIVGIKYPNMSARQTFAYSNSLRVFLDSIALSKESEEADRLIRQYFEYPEFCEVLKQKVYMTSGWKYKIAGMLLHGRKIGLLISLMKTRTLEISRWMGFREVKKETP